MDIGSKSSSESKLIYESSDGGKTIRARAFGSLTDILVINTDDPGYKSDYDRWKEAQAEDNLWFDIRQRAKTDPALQEELERVKMLYYLMRNDE